MRYTIAQRDEIARRERIWLEKLCGEHYAEWNRAVEDELANDPLFAEDEFARRYKVEQRLAENAAQDKAQLGAEIDRMLIRTSIIVAATTLLFAVYAFKASVALGVLLAAVAFIAALLPMCPPIRRAWADKYIPRHIWTLLATNHFKQWVIDCWLADRRTDVITRYKRAHSVAIPVLALAAVITAGILTRNYLK